MEEKDIKFKSNLLDKMSTHSTYLEETKKVLEAIDSEQVTRIADILWQARNDDRTVFIFGNGGSGALAGHFVGDLAECTGKAAPKVSKRLRVQCLAENITTLLAVGNDLSYEDIFVEQLKTYFRSGDVVIGVSGSGNSENVLCAVSWAKEHGGQAIGLTGFSGGKLKDLVDECLIVAVNDMQHVEDGHTIVMHSLMQDIQARMEAEEKI